MNKTNCAESLAASTPERARYLPLRQRVVIWREKMIALILGVALLHPGGRPVSAHKIKVIVRHQTGSEWTEMLGAGGGYQVGLATYSPVKCIPVYWHGDMNDGTAANAGPYAYAQMTATDGDAVGGRGANALGAIPMPWHALLWLSVNQPPADLHPQGFFSSEITCISGGWQGGFADVNKTPKAHPFLWHGSAASAVDLLPAGAVQGHVRAMTEHFQYGSVQFSQEAPLHAAVWSGSAASFHDVTPDGYQAAVIAGAFGDQAVGWARPNGRDGEGFLGQALIWTADGVTNLHPSGAFASVATATDGTTQVGFVMGKDENTERAAMWTGSADSYVDLHALLPDGYETSWATGVEGGTVSGYAWRYGGTQIDAIIWQL